jgi:tetratricopeptide (TPR) repeat protein
MSLYSKAISLKNDKAVCFPWMERTFLCLAVLLSYASVWPNEFVFDDKYLIVLNEFLKHWRSLPQLLTSPSFAGGGLPEGFYRPVQMMIYFLIYQAFGPSTIAFHALNVSLQALNACLLHHFGIRAGFKKGAAFAAALLWAVHPLHTTDITYMSSTAELLWSCFCLLGLIALLPDFAPRKVGLALIFFMLALACKESAVVFPALTAVTFFFVSKKRAQFSAYLKMWPLWLLSAGYIAAWLWFIHSSGYNLNNSGSPMHTAAYMSNFTNRVLTCLASLTLYARLIIWPAGLHIERAFTPSYTLLAWQPAVGALMAGLALLQIIWGRMRQRKDKGLALSFGLLWFAIAFSPVTGIIIPVDALISEGWMYMPMMGLFLGVAETMAGFFEKRPNAARLLVSALAFSLGLATFLQNEVWRNTETLYRSIAQNGGRSYQLSIPLGVFYLERGEFNKAIGPFNVALDHTDGRPQIRQETHLRLAAAWLQIRPDDRGGISLGDILSALPACRHIPEATRELGQILAENPDFYWAHAALAIIYRYQGNNQMADFHEQQVKAILQKQGSR